VESLLDASASADGFLEDPARLDLSAIGEHIGVYRVVREIGEGGMGVVYEAVRADREFDRRVAIKLVKFGMDTDFLRQRFRMERQILAGINHPNIASLLDGGTTADGRPYLVMEFVEGVPLLEYCAGKNLDITERLNLFRTICGAVQFAHQNLIVHRDVKPGNILVTADGVPKLLDFGIAKVLSPEMDPAPAGITGVILTPDYASPEQVRGEPITTVTDIYSLGVVLYQLLTGVRPYKVPSTAPHEIARAICEAEPIRPSLTAPKELRNRLAGDLDNIVLKAIRKLPGERYASAEQFAEDIGRSLRGLPVMARPDTLGYRAGKFVRRRKAAVGATAVAVILLLAALADAQWQARRAQRRFNDVRRLSHALLFDIYDSIQNIPGSTGARQLVISNALAYLDSLTREASGDASLQAELASAYERIGDVQGGFRASSLGDPKGAERSYRKALEIRESLARAKPSDQDIHRELLRTHGKLSDLLFQAGKTEGSAEQLRAAIALARELALANPASKIDRRNLAVSYLDFGYKRATRGHWEEGLQSIRDSIGELQKLTANDPADRQIQRLLAIASGREGQVLQEHTQRYSEALDAYRREVATAGALIARDGHNADLNRILAYAWTGEGDVLGLCGRSPEAVAAYGRSLAILQTLSDADPKNVQLHADLGLTEFALGTAHSKMASKSGRAADWRQAREYLVRSLPALQDAGARGLLDPSDRTKPGDAARAIERCDAALR
jgi:tetratricopeptide (TPR) repeat protein/predicted Ser/Thr protein kinase